MKYKNSIFCFAIILHLLLYWMSVSWQLFPNDIQLISDPKPTHIEKNLVKLVKVKEITEEMDDEHFFAIPDGLTVSDNGNLYVYDSKLVNIFMLDKNFKFVSNFLRRGSGPGETDGFLNGSRKIYYSKNGMIYFSSPGQKKVIEFNTKGEYVRDIYIPLTLIKNFFPVVDKNQNYYTLSKSGAVDVFNKNQKKISTLLSMNDYYRFLIYKPDNSTVHNAAAPGEMNTFYDALPDNGFIIYLVNSSTIYTFKNNQLLKKFQIWPKKAIETYLLVINDMKARTKKKNWFVPFAWNFFVDKDNENFFYIDFRYSLDKITLYKFNLEGELIKVLYKKGRGNFFVKKHNLFYGIDQGTIYIYKEE